MLTLTDGQKAFLQEATEREVSTRLEIVKKSTGEIVKVIETTADDLLDGETLAITSGSVRVDTSSEVLRTLSLQLADPNHEVTVGPGGLIDLDKYFKVYKGYKIPAPWGSGQYVTWPQGVFVLNGQPEIDATGGQRIIHLQAGDKTCLANKRPRGVFQNAIRISQGVTKVAAIQTIAQAWSETLFNLTPLSTATIPYDQPFTAQDSPWEAGQRINSLPEPNDAITRLYYDPTGRLTLAVDPGPDIENLPAVWAVKPTTEGPSQLVGARLSMDLLSLRNAVRVYFGSSRSAPGVVTVSDSNPNSLTYTGRIDWLLEEWKGGQQDDLIHTAGEATARANYELRRLLSYQERVPMRIVENPALEPWDVIEVVESQADISGKYQLLSYTIDLGNAGVMEAEGWKVRKLA